ncbi:MAG: AAA family ATPase, partial [Nitrospinaceae bacterium]|nr:ATP-binding protein [Nitrospinaceae bacterium]NIR57542.1 ATP-binding protein [Nitrospinaceae bacterium]NIS88012.1 ATP-binding protein [Nitrospinaceae bacterium]NIT84876.1 ATP-binding protein [Nitrospinaceae bacterium]NIU47052.1 ATP-binding protein [Nitrospinaceae bacterium]
SLEELLGIYKDIFQLESLSGRVILFDEIQYLKNWDVQLKVLVDTFKDTKFIASGSAASALRRKSIESGAGRFTDFLLPPLTFYEYLEIHPLIERDSLISHSRGALDIEGLNREFVKYINYGGFPEAIFDPDIQNNPQRFIRSDIIDKVLLRDLPALYGISDPQELYRLFSALVYQTGSEISYEGLSQSSGIAKNTIKKYINYLEAAFLIQTVRRVDDTGKTFQKQNFLKVYLTNPSLYSAIYEPVDGSDSKTLGSLVETAIFSQW